MQFADKIEEIARLEAEINIFAGNIRALGADKAVLQKRVDDLYAECLAEMKENGVVKDNAGSYVVTRRKNPATVDVTDINAVPDEYIRLKKEPDKAKIKDAALAGLKANWLVINEGTESLTIKGVV